MLLHCRTVSGHGDINAKQPAILLMQVDQTLTIGGWVKTGREAGGGKWIFLEVNDGTSFQSLQVTPQSSLQAASAHLPLRLQVSGVSKFEAFAPCPRHGCLCCARRESLYWA